MLAWHPASEINAGKLRTELEITAGTFCFYSENPTRNTVVISVECVSGVPFIFFITNLLEDCPMSVVRRLFQITPKLFFNLDDDECPIPVLLRDPRPP